MLSSTTTVGPTSQPIAPISSAPATISSTFSSLKQSQKSIPSKVPSVNTPLLFPAPNYSIITNCISRCSGPILPQNIPFLETLKLQAIINVSEYPFQSDDNSSTSFPSPSPSPSPQQASAGRSCLSKYIRENKVVLYDMISIGEKGLPFLSSSSVANCEKWTVEIIEHLSAPSLRGGNVLLLGSPRSCIDAVIIGCIRKVQHWTISSIISEFRMLTGRRILDLEQFIENFVPPVLVRPTPCDEELTDVLRSSAPALFQPEFLDTLASLEVEGTDLSSFNVFDENFSDLEFNSSCHSLSSDQTKLETVKLLSFPAKNMVVSSNVRYDPFLSLLNDKDDNED